MRSFSHSIVIKIIAFIIVIGCLTGASTIIGSIIEFSSNDFESVFQDSYYHSSEYMMDSRNILDTLVNIASEYKNEEYILNGGTISRGEIESEEEILFSHFRENSSSYDPKLSRDANFTIFKSSYANEIAEAREKLIQNDLKQYNGLLQRLNEYEGIVYYASDGENMYSNTTKTDKQHFLFYPSYLIFDKTYVRVSPTEIKENDNYDWLISEISEEGYNKNSYHISFTEEFLDPRIKEWNENKQVITNALYRLGGFLLGLIISFIYLLITIGKKSFKDKEVYLNSFDRLYTDINFGICIGVFAIWFETIRYMYIPNNFIPITISIAPVALIMLIFGLSLVKHFKNRTLIKHSLVYTMFYKIFKFAKAVYESGSLGVKIVLIAIGYPVLIALTIFIFPVTIGAAAWLALKRVKDFKAIKEGVEKIKDGDIYHKIEVPGNGEFGQLATNINSIAEGLNKAVDNELKSERLKTELITNVSHDIRTPLTSIITYVDLLKTEKDLSKAKEYIEILDQKSQRLKTLTDDLFEAAKASSGTVPVNYEKIDIVSLITQGLGELNDKIEESELDFKINHGNDKMYVTADGKLLWRAIENLLSNIFKYALKGSRVYVDIEDLGNEVKLVLKNISANELNISSNELMERFKRGDESRSSQGSGLGLSIAKSLVDIQKGRFSIEIDGDLFKAIMQIPKYQDDKQ